MITADSLHIYMAIRNASVRSNLEDQIVLDGLDVSAFASAVELWELFQQKPSRMVITDLRFDSAMTGLDLVRKIRQNFLMPYVYAVVLSNLRGLPEIKAGLAAGADDYIIKPHNPLQIRSRVMVGLRWLNYIDSLHTAKAAAK